MGKQLKSWLLTSIVSMALVFLVFVVYLGFTQGWHVLADADTWRQSGWFFALMLVVTVAVAAESAFKSWWHAPRTRKIAALASGEHTAQDVQVHVPWPVGRRLLTVAGLLLASASAGMLAYFVLREPLKSFKDVTSSLISMMFIGLFLYCLMLWLRLFYLAWRTFGKGFFLQANARGVEHCLFPFIPWSAVKGIQLEIEERSRRTDAYWQVLRIDADWLKQQSLPRLWFMLWFTTGKTGAAKSGTALYMPCTLLGSGNVLLVEQLKALRRQYVRQKEDDTAAFKQQPFPHLARLKEQEKTELEGELATLSAVAHPSREQRKRMEEITSKLDFLYEDYSPQLAQLLANRSPEQRKQETALENMLANSEKHTRLLDELSTLSEVQNPTTEQNARIHVLLDQIDTLQQEDKRWMHEATKSGKA